MSSTSDFIIENGVLKKYVYTDLGSLFECTETKYIPNHFSLVGFESY